MTATPIDYKEKSSEIMRIGLPQIMRALPQYVFLKDRASAYLGCNLNYARLVGLRSPEDIIGKTDQELNWQPSGDTAERFQQGDRDTLSGHPVTNQQETLVLPNGKKLVTLVSKLPIVDKDGSILGVVGYFTDVTALKEKERELRLAKQQADAANQAKSDFLMNISHDLRTPLSGLLGMAGLLEEEVQSSPGKAAVKDLIRAGGQLLALLNELIEFSKYEAGDLPIYEIKFNLKALVEDVMALQIPAAREKQLDFHLEWDNQLPVYVIGDATRLQRIFLNLISNAIKFTAQGAVTVGLRRLRGKSGKSGKKSKNRQVVIEGWVQDTGIGIPADKQQQIFSRFTRLHPAYQGRYPGSGLGLAWVKQFIEDLKGEIYVESAPSQETTFTFLVPLKIPLSEDARHARLPRNSTPPNAISCSFASPFAKKRVLLVEDNRIVQRAVKNQLTACGVSVETADDGTQALEFAQRRRFDLIVLDLGLPDQDGCTVAAALRQWQAQQSQPPSVMVALSAHLNATEVRRCREAGIQKAFTKPLDAEQLQNLLALIGV